MYSQEKVWSPTFAYPFDAFEARKQCFRKRYRQVSGSTMHSLDGTEVSSLELRAVYELMNQRRDKIYSCSAVSGTIEILL